METLESQEGVESDGGSGGSDYASTVEDCSELEPEGSAGGAGRGGALRRRGGLRDEAIGH
eukprot:3429129-Prymnesium_polylepis.1